MTTSSYKILRGQEFEKTSSGRLKTIKSGSKVFQKLIKNGYIIHHQMYLSEPVEITKYNILINGEFKTTRSGKLRQVGKNYNLPQGASLVPVQSQYVYIKNRITGEYIPRRVKIDSKGYEKYLAESYIQAPEEESKNSKNISSEDTSSDINPTEEEQASYADRYSTEVFPDSKIIKINDELSQYIKLVLDVYALYKKGYHNVLVNFILKDGRNKPYTLPIHSLLTNDGEWDTKFALKRLMKFKQHPELYKTQWVGDEIRKNIKRLRENVPVGYSDDDYEDAEFDSIGYTDADQARDAQEFLASFDNSDFVREIEEAWDEIMGGDYDADDIIEDGDDIESDSSLASFGGEDSDGYSLQNTPKVFRQINKEIEHNSCFSNALTHYGLTTSLKGLVSIEQIKEELARLDVGYIIYDDELPDGKIKINNGASIILPTSSRPNNMQKYWKANFTPTIYAKYIPPRSPGSRVYTFAIRWTDGSDGRINHIFVPSYDPIAYYVNNSITNLFQISKTTKGLTYMKRIFSLSKPKYINYIFLDVEANECVKNRVQKLNSVSIFNIVSDYDLHKFSEEELINKYKNAPICYRKAGKKDTDEDIQKYTSDRVIVSRKLNLSEITTKFMKEGCINKILAFNGAGYDNLFLLKSFRKNNIHVKISVNNGLLEINSVKGSKFKFSTQDVKRIIGAPPSGDLGSLEAFCKKMIKNPDYRKTADKELFPLINERYKEGRILGDDDETIAFNKRFIEYNDRDTISMMLVYAAMLRSFTISTGENNTEQLMSSCISQAQYSMKRFKRSIRDFPKNKKPKKFSIPKIKKGEDEELYNSRLKDFLDKVEILQKFKTGGRCQAKKTKLLKDIIDKKSGETIRSKVFSLDVASLYPFIMMCYNKSYFMAGGLKETDKYVEGKLGLYFGTVTQVKKTKKDDEGYNEMGFFCEKSECMSNNWNVWGKPISCLISSHEIENILKNKPHWSYTIDWGFYSDDSVRGIELFQSLEPFMKDKAKQDLLMIEDAEYRKKNRDDSEYTPKANVANREMDKNNMNALSGKFMQWHKRSEVELIRSKVENAMSQVVKFNLQEIDYLKQAIKKDKMLHIGIFIYSLSKIYMYKNAYSVEERKDGLLQTIIGILQFAYTDTDSNKIVKREIFDIWMKLRGGKSMASEIWPELIKDSEHPELCKIDLGYTKDTTYFYNGVGIKCMGQFEDEYAGKEYDRGLVCDKKEYMFWNSIKPASHSIKFKGFNPRRILVLDEKSEMVGLGEDDTKTIQIYYQLKGAGKNSAKYTPQMAKSMGVRNMILYTKINKKIYEESQWQKFSKMQTDIEYVSKELETNPTAYIDKFKQLMLNKMNKKKSFILVQCFKRDMYDQTVRNEFMIKQI